MAQIQQILEGNDMKHPLTAHSITYSALNDLHMETIFKSESVEVIDLMEPPMLLPAIVEELVTKSDAEVAYH